MRGFLLQGWRHVLLCMDFSRAVGFVEYEAVGLFGGAGTWAGAGMLGLLVLFVYFSRVR